MMNDTNSKVYIVPLVDVNWLTFAPFDPARDFRIDPPKVEQSIGETRSLCDILRDLTDGKTVLTPHSGTYCRSGYYEGEFIDIYRSVIANGGEVAVHLHEEIKGGGTRFGDKEHIREVFFACKQKYSGAEIPCRSYRGGHSAYAPFMNGFMKEADMDIDFSCAPGLNMPDREAIWVEAGLSGYYLASNPRDPSTPDRSHSQVFEIPIGSDGEGAAYGNILHIEQSNLENLMRIWNLIVDRAQAQDTPQIVHSLFHTGSMSQPDNVERFKRFLEFMPANGGVFVTPSEAKIIYDSLET